MTMKHNTLNQIIQQNGYKSYLEIGVALGHNFQLIKCENKKGVEPEKPRNPKIAEQCFIGTSDAFFKQNEEKYDLIFIDGLHHADQAEKDVINAYDSLNMGGMLIMHDVNPFNEAMTIVPRRQEQWTGDVFKVWAGIIDNTNLDTKYYPEKYGLGAVVKTRKRPKEGMTSDITYSEFAAKRKKYCE